MTAPLEDKSLLSEDTRAWMYGFFSGFMGLEPQFYTGADLTDSDEFVVIKPAFDSINLAQVEDEQIEDYPWHDPGLPIVERMDMATDKPFPRKLMAAMGQLDCGTCGYLCKTYAEAIANGEESSLTLCSPGGNETKQMLKKLIKQNGPIEAAESSDDSEPEGWSRKNPFPAKLVCAKPLNKEGSAKATTHVEIDLSMSGLEYVVGDALGVQPTNCTELVADVITKIGADATTEIQVGSFKGTLAQTLTSKCCLKTPTDELLEFVATQNGDDLIQKMLAKMLDIGVPDGIDVLDILKIGNLKSVPASDFVGLLEPLKPRLYSIASSMKMVGDEVHLTVGKVVYERSGRQRKGVASTMFADRLNPGDTVGVYVVKNGHGFTVPQDPGAPMIMVGPGTGIAPFMAFLQERHASKSLGNNWLFFGDQHAATDFLYEDRLRQYVDNGLLTKLTTAFSRDGNEKVYVQNRMIEHAQELWQWLQQDGHFYVCGDASRMAADVEKALLQIISEQGSMSAEDAKAYLDKMSADKRYVRDVY